jgi:hypothetical protein
MITGFNEQLWIDFDLEIAVFLENLAAWLRINASKDNEARRNYHEGRYWSYDSYTELSKRFPGWSSKTIRTIVARCVKKGLILIGNFNKKKYDNTNWYTLTDTALVYFPLLHGSTLNTVAQTGKTLDQMGRPIPEKPNSLSSNINITTSVLGNADSSSNISLKPDYLSESEKVDLYSPQGLDPAAYTLKSDYQNNQT